MNARTKEQVIADIEAWSTKVANWEWANSQVIQSEQTDDERLALYEEAADLMHEAARFLKAK